MLCPAKLIGGYGQAILMNGWYSPSMRSLEFVRGPPLCIVVKELVWCQALCSLIKWYLRIKISYLEKGVRAEKG